MRIFVAFTIEQLTTPFQNPNSEMAHEASEKPDEIEVTDPTHPLFGRRFPLHSASASSRGGGQVWVVYRGHILLRLPWAATSLAPAPSLSCPLKLTAAAVQELGGLLQPTPSLFPAYPPHSWPH